jgi:rubrerythrin
MSDETQATSELLLHQLQGMARVVRYLRERAEGVRRVTDGMRPETDADRDLQRTHSLKALAVAEAAHQVEEGIARAVAENFPHADGKPHTVCPSCGALLAIHGHGECPRPCYENHNEMCSNPKCRP